MQRREATRDDSSAARQAAPTENIMSDIVTYSLRATAAVITINRPDKRNALSRALIAALCRCR